MDADHCTMRYAAQKNDNNAAYFNMQIICIQYRFQWRADKRGSDKYRWQRDYLHSSLEAIKNEYSWDSTKSQWC
jgi:hypothetical protein